MATADRTPKAELRDRPKVVIVGVGHAGMEAAKALRKAPVDVVLIDRHNFHKFQPLLYQVATAGLHEGHITQPARHIFQKQKNLSFRLGTVIGADFEARRLSVEPGPEVDYDYLILAPGASTAFFGVEGAEEYAFPLKNVADALALRSHILGQFEAADRNPALIDQGILNFVVVGGGATGVETAGALRELFDMVLTRDHHSMDVARSRIVLVEAADTLMAGYKERLRDYTRRVLEKRGVEVRLETAVERVDPEGVLLASGEMLPARTVIWAAGVRAHPLADVLGVEQTRGARIVVDPHLNIPGLPEVFVTGDAAAATDSEGDLYPQVGQSAIQQGKHAARQIVRELEKKPREPFQYRDLGMMATVGRNAAILQLPSGFALTGFLAWVGWLLIHLLKLVGFRNRIGVLYNWTYNYFTWDRGPRLIQEVRPEPDTLPPLSTSHIKDKPAPVYGEELDAPNGGSGPPLV